jgi:hypothetical protein
LVFENHFVKKPANSKNKPKYKWLRMRQILILPTP